MLHKQKHTETHVCHEREYVDNGTTVRETVHYHVSFLPLDRLPFFFFFFSLCLLPRCWAGLTRFLLPPLPSPRLGPPAPPQVHNIIQPVIYRDRPIPSTCVPAASLASSARHPLQHHNHQQTTAPSSRAGPASREGGRGLAGQELGVAR